MKASFFEQEYFPKIEVTNPAIAVEDLGPELVLGQEVLELETMADELSAELGDLANLDSLITRVAGDAGVSRDLAKEVVESERVLESFVHLRQKTSFAFQRARAALLAAAISIATPIAVLADNNEVSRSEDAAIVQGIIDETSAVAPISNNEVKEFESSGAVGNFLQKVATFGKKEWSLVFKIKNKVWELLNHGQGDDIGAEFYVRDLEQALGSVKGGEAIVALHDHPLQILVNLFCSDEQQAWRQSYKISALDEKLVESQIEEMQQDRLTAINLPPSIKDIFAFAQNEMLKDSNGSRIIWSVADSLGVWNVGFTDKKFTAGLSFREVLSDEDKLRHLPKTVVQNYVYMVEEYSRIQTEIMRPYSEKAFLLYQKGDVSEIKREKAKKDDLIRKLFDVSAKMGLVLTFIPHQNIDSNYIVAFTRFQN